MDNRILIYGATGYMGKLFAKELLKQGLQPILAARSTKVQALDQQLNCPSVIFNLDNPADIVSNLQGITLVVNLAGPFAKTQGPLIQACLQTGCHYIDIAGEVDEMVSAFAFDDAAKQAGIMLMPGAGFGVVPTDIVASLAKQQLPDASTLKILYATEGEVSRGTLKTVLSGINQPGVRRAGGELVTAYPAESKMTFEVAGRSLTAVYNPWRADLFTAGLSTGIDNIQTYSVFPGFVVQMMKGKRLWLRDLLVNRLLNFLPEGPTEKQLAQGNTYVMAIASNSFTDARIALKGPEAYLFTALCLREVSNRILSGPVEAGFQTPAYFGKVLLDHMDGIQWD
ncbi:MAG: NAD(P)H-binding protein [Symploca sp. SIO2B6]|nr:NAD(P)H-binding protein [Symploca sp. SIO2B6]